MGNSYPQTYVANLLQSMEYKQYISQFHAKGYEVKESLFDITKEQLKSLGVLPGHIGVLYKKFEELKILDKQEREMKHYVDNQTTISVDVTVVGKSSAGKSTLIQRYIENKIDEDVKMTDEKELPKKFKMIMFGKTIKVTMHDAPGQSAFWEKTKEKGFTATHVVVGVCSVDQKSGFLELNREYMSTVKETYPHCSIAVICNKCDLKTTYDENYKKICEEIKQFCSKNELQVYYVSAMKGDGVVQAFDDIISNAIKQYQNEKEKIILLETVKKE